MTKTFSPYPSMGLQKEASHKEVKIVIVEFSEYALYRTKKLGSNTISCGLGRLLDNLTKHAPGLSFEAVLVVNQGNTCSKSQYKALLNQYSFLKDILFHDNVGTDMGAYHVGYHYWLNKDFQGEIAFMNSSAAGPRAKNWLLAYHFLLNQEPSIGLCGASMNSHIGSHRHNKKILAFSPHIQTYFFYTSTDILNTVFKNKLPGADIQSTLKSDRVEKGEIMLSYKILEHGYGIKCMLFHNFTYKQNTRWTLPWVDFRRRFLFAFFASKI